MLREKHASALLSTGVFGVRGTPGHPSTRPAMCGCGAEWGLVFAPPGFQHRLHSSTNGLVNTTKEETMTEKQKSVLTFYSISCRNLAPAGQGLSPACLECVETIGIVPTVAPRWAISIRCMMCTMSSVWHVYS